MRPYSPKEAGLANPKTQTLSCLKFDTVSLSTNIPGSWSFQYALPSRSLVTSIKE